MKKLKIEAGKFYRTRDGRKAGIYRTDAKGKRPIHGYIVDSEENAFCWYKGGYSFSNRDVKYENDLISEWQEPLDFDWNCLPKWANKYIAADPRGNWFSSNSKITFVRWGLNNQTDILGYIPKEYQPKNFTGNWEDSLFKNPNLD